MRCFGHVIRMEDGRIPKKRWKLDLKGKDREDVQEQNGWSPWKKFFRDLEWTGRMSKRWSWVGRDGDHFVAPLHRKVDEDGLCSTHMYAESVFKILIVLLIFQMNVSSADVGLRHSSFKFMKNFRLEYCPTVSSLKVSKLHCALQCLEEVQCVAFNYEESEQTCYICNDGDVIRNVTVTEGEDIYVKRKDYLGLNNSSDPNEVSIVLATDEVFVPGDLIIIQASLISGNNFSVGLSSEGPTSAPLFIFHADLSSGNVTINGTDQTHPSRQYTFYQNQTFQLLLLLQSSRVTSYVEGQYFDQCMTTLLLPSRLRFFYSRVLNLLHLGI